MTSISSKIEGCVRKIVYFAPGILCDALRRRLQKLELPRISVEIFDISRLESTVLEEVHAAMLEHVPTEGSPIIMIGNQGYFGEMFLAKCKARNSEAVIVMCSFEPESLPSVDFFLKKSESTLFKDIAWFISECGELLKKDSVVHAPLFRSYKELRDAEYATSHIKMSMQEMTLYEESISQ